MSASDPSSNLVLDPPLAVPASSTGSIDAAPGDSRQRIDAIDVAKGLGIILVVFGHVWRGSMLAGLQADGVWYHRVDNWIYAFHMPLFFLLAGLFIERSAAKPLGRTVTTKLLTLAYPYVIWSLIQGVITARMSGVTNASHPLADLPRLILIEPFGQFWFLYVLLLAEVGYCVLRKLGVPIAALLVASVYLFSQAGLITSVVGSEFATNFVYLVLGSILATPLVSWFRKPNRSVAIGISAICATILTASVLWLMDAHWSVALVQAVIGIAMVIGLSIGCSSIFCSIGVAFIGRLSLQIYLAHILFAAGTRIVLMHVLHLHSLPLELMIATLSGLFGPLVLWFALIRLRASWLMSAPVADRPSESGRGTRSISSSERQGSLDPVLPFQSRVLRLGRSFPVRYPGLDVWRGIAALLVVACHAGLLVSGLQPDNEPNDFYHFCGHGIVGVQVFFVISGYCIAAAAMPVARGTKSIFEYISARVWRIYPACWASLLFVLLLSAIARKLVSAGVIGHSFLAANSAPYSVGYLVSNFTLTELYFHQPFLSVVCWTLCYEISFYAIIGALVLISTRKNAIHDTLVGAHVLTIGCMIALMASPNPVPFPFDLWPQFGIGVILFDLLTSADQRRAIIAGAITTVLLAVYIIGFDQNLTWLRLDSRMSYAAAIVSATILYGWRYVDASGFENPAVKLLAWIGGFSYSLYLIHYSALGLGDHALTKLLQFPAGHMAFFLSLIGLAILAGWIFWKFVESPMQRIRPPWARTMRASSIH